MYFKNILVRLELVHVQVYPRYLRGVFWSNKVVTIWLTNQVTATFQLAGLKVTRYDRIQQLQKSQYFLHTLEGSIGAFFGKNFFCFNLRLKL